MNMMGAGAGMGAGMNVGMGAGSGPYYPVKNCNYENEIGFN
jgi:hypothetical protein